MVRAVICLALVALAAPVHAADWSISGGALFVGDAVPNAVAASATPAAQDAEPYAAEIAWAAERHGVDPRLLRALVIVESGYDPRAVSAAGAAGLTQLMPGAARETGVLDRFDPAQNLSGGARYFADQLARFGDVELALAAYNSGPIRVAKLGRVPGIPETQTYVRSVVDCFLALTAGRAVHSRRDCRAGARR